MARKKILVMPSTKRRLEKLGEQIKYARLRRRLSISVVAERAGTSRSSVYAVEKGDPGVSIGIYAGILLAIGMPDEITLPCRDDVMGRYLQDGDLKIRRRKKD
ncbi:MAG: helix-turn-helix domain-containing protein [Lachnospiraceae bacterium]|nr:helix-turn-helix domain-containing protein [Lachnospiraceae bacterium]